jgi:poly(3-hydroxybutyrate) depolymerase
MSTPIPRRTVLTAAGAAAVGLAVPGVAEAAGRVSSKIKFTLNAETLDGGEQVVSVTLKTAGHGSIVPASLTPSTFTVHAKATSPIPLAANDVIYSEYDVDRVVTTARLDRRGNIVLELRSEEGEVGGGTLGYIVSKGRNVQLDLEYTITQNAPLRLRNGRNLRFTKLVQGELSNPEVDAFGYAVSPSGMKYRLFAPSKARGKRPLIVWLHGGGEGASLPDDYYDNESTLRANRGALGFATPEGQRIFDGAYVVAPQSFSAWMQDGPRFAPQIKEIIDEVVRRYPIDRDRIHVVGCSNGGYMTMKMTVEYPKFFASAVPICGVVQNGLITDAQLTRITTPTWLVTSADDATVDPVANTEHAHDLIPRSIMTMYDNVTWDGHQFAGHWSWIYVARNDPRHRGTRIWQWMARQES